ncbi:MAG: DUF4290 domain-containing protein [Flavobacteriales bacterium]|jgi:hypothetical protein|nr:DUF4290 domain-containing protein [Flavobacteriales bacterium]
MDNITSLEYNTERPQMTIPEYGRNVQNMINHCLTIVDKEERNKCAQAIITVMGQVNPQLKDVEDYDHKLWDHLFIMSNFQLDVDSPYPKPSADFFEKKPEKIPYPHRKIKYGHYGAIMEDLIAAAVKLEDGEEKTFLIKRIANLLKTSYLLWNRNTVNDEVIVRHLEEYSKGQLTINPEELTDTKEILSHFKKNYNISNPISTSNNRKRNKKNKSNYRRK